MLYFINDYQEGAHHAILERLIETNLTPLTGYGTDAVCDLAKDRIRSACACPEAEVFFLCGGTQANRVVISSLLNQYEGVIAAKTGHVSVHEAGAIEASGHKVLELAGIDGRIDTAAAREYASTFFSDENNDHMVFPGMIYISFPTELGTLYSKAELVELRRICDEYKLLLYVDGARLGYALASPECEVSLEELAALSDVFYIGGTKMGALIGEAVVFPKGKAPKHFITLIKQNGALLAKGRLLGVQFDALFTDGLYFKLGKHAIDMADELKRVFKRKGVRFYLESPTNQQFIFMENKEIERLREKVQFSFWEKYGETESVVRFVTSWATTRESIAELERIL
ncbi:MAG: low specificity L-threonine aldolase [Clostridia bacterium]|nr:low specificity L-threonine aldolase [Clostridia bacterium]